MTHESDLTYLQAGEYQIPDLHLPVQEPLGKYGRMRKTFLKENRYHQYTSLLVSGALMEHLYQIEQETLLQVKRTEQLLLHRNPAPDKVENSYLWGMHMTAIRRQAEELVLPETVYR